MSLGSEWQTLTNSASAEGGARSCSAAVDSRGPGRDGDTLTAAGQGGMGGKRAQSALLVAAFAAALLPARLDSAAPPLRTRQISLPTPTLPKRPLLMQLNTRVLVSELAQSLGRPASLDDIPDAALDDLASTGFHIVYLLGVWRTGMFGLNKSKKLLSQDPCMAGFSEEDVGSSPFAITEYAVPEDLGGDDALGRLCARIHSRRMRVVVDFVPNHVAIDHPWVKTHPHFLIKSRNDEHVRDPGSYFESGGDAFAFGRGLLWEPWEDTVQLNYGEPELRQAMLGILRKIAGMVDGVRCDVAMLVEQELLLSTWGDQLEPERDPSLQDTSEFWPAACREARQVNPNFLFIAESYWEREQALMYKGFDFCYDKVFYDRLVQGDGEGIDHLLNLGRNYQVCIARVLRFHPPSPYLSFPCYAPSPSPPPPCVCGRTNSCASLKITTRTGRRRFCPTWTSTWLRPCSP